MCSNKVDVVDENVSFIVGKYLGSVIMIDDEHKDSLAGKSRKCANELDKKMEIKNK